MPLHIKEIHWLDVDAEVVGVPIGNLDSIRIDLGDYGLAEISRQYRSVFINDMTSHNINALTLHEAVAIGKAAEEMLKQIAEDDKLDAMLRYRPEIDYTTQDIPF